MAGTYPSKTNIGWGTLLQYFKSSTWTPVTELFEVDPPAPKGTKIDVSHYQSPTDASGNPFEEKKSGWFDGGQVKFKANLLDSVAATLSLLRGSANTLQWECLLPPTGSDTTSGLSITYTGFIIEGPKVLVPNKEKMTHEFTIEVTGVPVFTAGS